ncbi:glycerophosphoryl diester phosphodiesterase family protein [Trinickia symbiotica]|uniref:Glycerophosphodiester phosphodiesterase 1 n=1 Tax=Trinickia symbiotica TaxID=863227 RepID=A0A2N7X6H8_9BURK|nr:glycerophosphodiester phosphodiesterase family protein [Trinickia symbiotica]PMS37210.1 glycerophosphodiester phosphodiesterase 1 [Trinickia symbiotica]PPK42722.1 glycerophosphoryl diester phosphodiesterase family protein [Trinickia symbiotica]
MNFFSIQLRRLLGAVFCTIAALSDTALADGPQHYDPERILEAFRNPYTGPDEIDRTIGIVAHRGVVSSGCPENSLCSIQNTYNNGIEAIELDVKQSSEGTPYLFHDNNVGRVDATSGFDIYTGKGWNADVRSLPDATLDKIMLRDKQFRITGYNALSLEEALDRVKSDYPNMLVILDIKTLDAISRAADIALHRGMQNMVVLKFFATLAAAEPENIVKYTKGVAFAPMIYARDEDEIANRYTDLGCEQAMAHFPVITVVHYHQCLVNSWLDKASEQSNFAWIEVGNKNPVDGDPTYDLVKDLRDGRKAMGAFNPVKEYRQNANDGRWYIRSNGTCCASLDDYLTDTMHFGNETADRRPNVDLQLENGFTSITTDDPVGAAAAASRSGMRDTSRYY